MSTSLPHVVRAYLKDAPQFRDHLQTNMTIREAREMMRRLFERDMEIFFLRDEHGCSGVFYAEHPFGEPDWIMVRLQSRAPREAWLSLIARHLLRREPRIYRLDFFVPATSSEQWKGFEAFSAQFSGGSFFHRFFTAPDFLEREVGFVRWPFGLLAVMTDKTRTVLERIDFIRAGHPSANPTVLSYLRAYGLEASASGGRSGPIEPPADLRAPSDFLREALTQIDEFVTGQRRAFSIPYRPCVESDFQKKVWAVLESIPYGHIMSYKDVALCLETDERKAIRMTRAVGQAIGRNPLPLIILCHRVIGQNRDLTGFSGGVDIKDYLLNMELLGVNPS